MKKTVGTASAWIASHRKVKIELALIREADMKRNDVIFFEMYRIPYTVKNTITSAADKVLFYLKEANRKNQPFWRNQIGEVMN